MIAVLIPCYNEGITIAKVVADFRAALPDAVIYVYDNNSTDGTQALANGAGAIVRRETLQGKGHVVRRMFADVEADIYVLVDGDGTYDAQAAPAMIAGHREVKRLAYLLATNRPIPWLEGAPVNDIAAPDALTLTSQGAPSGSAHRNRL